MAITPPTFLDVVRRLDEFWRRRGALNVFPWDLPKGAATFSPYTFFWALDEAPHQTAYLEPCRRPGDARYGDSPNRLGRYYQYQVFLKPAPKTVRRLYEESLGILGFKAQEHELRYIEDDWESPTLGASGVGWEVWLDGLEITQFTYFQSFAGFELPLIPVEITYGLERIAMYLQNAASVFDIVWDHGVRYGDIFHKQMEKEFSKYHFERFDAAHGFGLFDHYNHQAKLLAEEGLILPAYESVMRCSEIFNNLDARGAITAEERNRLIGRTRAAAKAVAAAYLKGFEKPENKPQAQAAPQT
ncbi:MAG: glycine--tRNA ligase subunit alpha [Elusimicrobia bacterium]|nr:glycine--tRNA ligase subunit alpha [Elusimicrobiota bacterium]